MTLPPAEQNFIPSTVYTNVTLNDPSGQIRLLKVLSAEPDVVICELQVVSLREAKARKFAALSYTWRHALYPEQNTLVYGERSGLGICNGVHCRLLENLHEALLQFGKQPDQLLWVDAICINQANATEKTLQVQLMSKIYRVAAKVFVWLGKSDGDTKNAVELINHLAEIPPHKLSTIHETTLNDSSVMGLLTCQNGQYHRLEYWLSLARLLSRTWFTRAWVVQEVILANPEGISVHCGEYEFEWSALRAISGYLSKSTWRQTFAEPGILARNQQPPRLSAAAKIGGTQDDIAKMTKLTFMGEPHDLFLDTLVRVREFDCQDPRDKAYCCYGIGSRFRPRDFPFPAPDYHAETSTAEAFTRTARAVLQMSQSLHLLAYSESLRSENLEGKDTMPSWVPDWTIPKKLGLGITGYRRYCAAANLMQNVEFADAKRRVLRLRAAWIDEVSLLGNSKDEIAIGSDLKATEGVIRMLKKNYTVGPSGLPQTHEEVLWRTLVHDTCPSSVCPANPTVASEFRPWLNAQGGAAIARALDDPAQATAGGSSVESTSRPVSTSSTRQTSDFGNNYALRTCLKLFCTKEGLLGLGAEAVEPGDTIWIVPGSRVPLLMRKPVNPSNQLPNHYQLVGAAYVHGLMYGEALKSQSPLHFRTTINVV